jgi:hypothetical protein
LKQDEVAVMELVLVQELEPVGDGLQFIELGILGIVENAHCFEDDPLLVFVEG